MVDFRKTLQEIDYGYNAILCAPGQFERNWDIFAARKSVTSIVRINWDSDYCFQWGYTKGIHGVVLSPTQAATMGVDVVLASISIGSGDAAVDSANVEMFAKLVAEALSVGLPIGGEVYPGVYGQVSPEAFHEADFPKLPDRLRAGRRLHQDLLYRAALQRNREKYSGTANLPGGR